VRWLQLVRLATAALACLTTLAWSTTAFSQALETVRLTVTGPSDVALSHVAVEVEGQRVLTDTQGVALVHAPEGTRTVRLRVPLAALPGAPTNQTEWVVDLADIPFVPNEQTEAKVSLGESGALLGLDIKPPEAAGGNHGIEEEFATAAARKPQGVVRGQVVSAEIGEPLEGARVYVRGAPVETLTDSEGKFSLSLPEGHYRLSVIQQTYATQNLSEVAVKATAPAELKVELSPASALDEILVTGSHIQGGVASLVAERRETSAVADVIGAEQMSRAGDSSAASALSRVTGLTVVDGKYVIVRGMGERYSNMTLNRMQVASPEPSRRVVPLDLFPTGVLESVVVQKTFSPDMPGEFGGGVVQLRSRSYPDELLVSLTGQLGFNTQTHLRKNIGYEGGKRDWLGYDDGSRQLPDDIAATDGKIVERGRFDPPGKNYTAKEIEKFGESFSDNYDIQRKLILPDFSVVGTVGNKFKLRVADLGIVASVGFKNEFNAVENAIVRTIIIARGKAETADDFDIDTFRRTVSLSAFLDWGVEFSKSQQLRFTSMLLRQSDDATSYRTGYVADLRGDARQTRLTWTERQVLLQQVTGLHRFENLHDFQIDWRYAFGRANREQPDLRDYLYEYEEDLDAYLISTSSGSNQRFFADLEDDTHEAAIDLVQPFGMWRELEGKLKLGGLFYKRKRDADVRRFEFDMMGLSATQREREPAEIFSMDSIGNGVSLEETTLANDTYGAEMQIEAGYGMLELPLHESFSLMGGARLEHAQINVTTYDLFSPDQPPTLAKLDDTDVLPAATVTWRFGEDFQLRGGYSKTLNRPDLRELSPSRFKDVETNATFVGNAGLKRARIDNYDGRLEWYYTVDELFSIGGFYKTFVDPIEATIAPAAGTVLSLANANEAVVMGLEFEGRKRFDFISEALETVYVAGNLSLIQSEVAIDLPGGEQSKRSLQSQSPWVVNAQLGWDDTLQGGTGTAITLLYNVSGRRIRAVGDPSIDFPDQYEEPIHRLDLVFSQDLAHGFRIGARGRNLLNPVQEWTQGGVVVRSFRRGVDLALSAAWSY
jgi:outer membrane receptor protein involved in Fe transport